MAQRKKRKIVIGTLLIVLLIVIGSGLGYAAFLTDKAKEAADNANVELARGDISEKRIELKRTVPVDPVEDNISILFLGVDDSEVRKYGGTSRSDAMVLATFNEKEKSIKLVSIPRDSYVYIPVEEKKDKITHAHAYGGIDGSVETVEELFNVPVDYYVELNFNAFIDVVNALNGIDFNVPFHISEKDSEDVHNAIVLDPGMQHLNGEEALALARTRKYDNDMKRGQRQMELMSTILSKVVSLSSIGKYGNIIDSLGKNMKTNMDFDEMTALREYLLNRDELNIEKMQLQGEDTYINDIYYFKLKEQSLDEIKNTLRTHLDLTDNTQNASTGSEA